MALILHCGYSVYLMIFVRACIPDGVLQDPVFEVQRSALSEWTKCIDRAAAVVLARIILTEGVLSWKWKLFDLSHDLGTD